MSADKVVVAVATYNEMENLPALVDAIKAAVPEAQLLIVDDDSPDGTGRWAQELADGNANIDCIVRSDERGLGTATLAAMQWAIDADYDWFVQLDADFSHPPKRIVDLLDATQQAAKPAPDVVIASRYADGGSIRGWPVHRRVMSGAVNGLARYWLRLPILDCSGSFRCYRVAKLAELDFSQVHSRGYSFFEEILWHLRKADASFVEVPYEFLERERGVTKLRFGEMLRSVYSLVAIGLRK